MSEDFEPSPPATVKLADMPFIPFPVDQLPPVLARFVQEQERTMQIDAAFLALPMLSALGSAIGNAAVVLLKSGYVQPPLLWTAPIGTSGSGKSPALRAALAPVFKRQHDLVRQFEQAKNDYETACAEYEASDHGSGDAGKPPVPPTLQHNVVSDSTTEALAVRLQQSPRGLLCGVDELAGLFKAFNAYKRAGNDMQAWLGFYDAGFVKIDRKGGPITTLIIDHAFVGLTGTIQPGILASVFNDEHFESGLSARFLFAMPPTLKRSWNEDEVDENTILAVRQAFEALYALPVGSDSNGKPSGKVLPLTVDAKKIWAAWHDELEEEISGIIDVDHPYALVLPKLRSAAARLALILQLVSYVSNDQHAAGDHIDATSMARGVALARWFKHEQQRVYDLLYETKGHRQIRRMVALVTDLGGSVSVRDWQRKRHLKTAAETEAELQRLVDVGYGSFCYYQNPSGGRSVKSFKLCDTTTDSDSESGRSSVTIRTIDIEENPLSSKSISTSRVTDVRPPGALKNGSSVT